MIKKYILGFLLAAAMPAAIAFASTPSLSFSGLGNNDVRVQVTGGEINSPVTLYYFSPSLGVYQGYLLGTSDINGSFSGVLNSNVLSNIGVNWGMPLYVQVGGYQTQSILWPYNPSSGTATGTIMFSNMSPNFAVGGTATITLSGGSGTYYVSSNSNTGVISTFISGNTLTLSGLNAGQSTVTVCSTGGGGCGTFVATVGGIGAPSLSSSNLNVAQGSQGSIIVSGGTSPYTITVSSGSGLSTTLVGNTLYINGTTVGTNTIQVCSANNGGCTPLTVNIQTQGIGTGTGGQIGFVVPVMMGQPLSLMLIGGSGTYFLQSPVTSPASANVSGNTLMLNGVLLGSGTVTVCQTGGSSCLPIYYTVTPALTGTGGGYLFDMDLWMGTSGTAVMELQTRLMDEGYFTATATGYFGPITQAAVQAYQRARGIPATGYVGPLTRAELNK